MEKCSNLENEIWKDIPNFEGYYQVSNYGRVRSLDRVIEDKNHKRLHYKGRILKPGYDNQGYQNVILCKNGIEYSSKIHQLVAKTFIPNPNNYPMINHKDENKTNNHVDNLEWCTAQYNIEYSFAKPITQFDLEGNFIKNWPSISVAGRTLNMSTAGIVAVCQGNKYTLHGFIFKYYKPEYNKGYKLKGPIVKPIRGNKISQFDMDGNYIKTWPNSVLAAKEVNGSSSNIRACCCGIVYSCKGFIFRDYRPEYKEGYNLFNIDIDYMLHTPVMKVNIKTGENLQLYSNCLQAYKETNKHGGGVVNGWQRIYHCCMGLIPFVFNYKWKFHTNTNNQ